MHQPVRSAHHRPSAIHAHNVRLHAHSHRTRVRRQELDAREGGRQHRPVQIVAPIGRSVAPILGRNVVHVAIAPLQKLLVHQPPHVHVLWRLSLQTLRQRASVHDGERARQAVAIGGHFHRHEPTPPQLLQHLLRQHPRREHCHLLLLTYLLLRDLRRRLRQQLLLLGRHRQRLVAQLLRRLSPQTQLITLTLIALGVLETRRLEPARRLQPARRLHTLPLQRVLEHLHLRSQPPRLHLRRRHGLRLRG
mmetsp:Transcript_15440/g.48035  ORF Transcript_15440/g.48035 Transcript_15440/m.48035 type:complete len:249 (-) Transcript_15440:106-852(-)